MQFRRGASSKTASQFKCTFLVFCCREMNFTINSLAFHRSVLGGCAGTPDCRWGFVWLIFAAFATPNPVCVLEVKSVLTLYCSYHEF